MQGSDHVDQQDGGVVFPVVHVAGDKVKGPGQTHGNEEPDDDEKALHPRLSDVLTGRRRPDTEAYGVRGEEEEDDIEGEQDADGSLQRIETSVKTSDYVDMEVYLLVSHLRRSVVEKAGPCAMVWPGKAQLHRR